MMFELDLFLAFSYPINSSQGDNWLSTCKGQKQKYNENENKNWNCIMIYLKNIDHDGPFIYKIH